MELRRVALPGATAGELRSFLAKFLFKGDDVYKHVRDLSGGEKGRLALAKLIYSRVNVLVLDEPTNHLDIPSREALEEALDAYEGTILTISHDRYFLDRVATQILALDGEGLAEHYDGDYTEYHDWKASGKSFGNLPTVQKSNLVSDDLSSRSLGAKVASKQVQSKPSAKSKQDGKRKAEVKTGSSIKVIKKNKTVVPVLLEAEIAETEKTLNEISAKMSLPEIARDATELIKLDEAYREGEARLSVLYSQWEEAVTKS
jgi:ATP-binding cassette subfamily F protein 3